MFKKIIDLFKSKRTPIDKLIEACGVNHVYLWNGVNYGREFMFFYSEDKATSPEKYPYLRIGLGEYISGHGDWGFGYSCATETVVDIYIDEARIIRRIVKNDGFYNGPPKDRRFESAVHRRLNRLKVGDKFELYEFSDLNRFIDTFFECPQTHRYGSIIKLGPVVFSQVDSRDSLRQMGWLKDSIELSKKEAAFWIERARIGKERQKQCRPITVSTI